MRYIYILFLLVAVSCAQQMGTIKITWDYNLDPDIYGYRIGLGVSSDSSYSDSVEYMGIFEDYILKIKNPDTAYVDLTSVLDGKYLFAFGSALDFYQNESDTVYSNIIKKVDKSPPGVIQMLELFFKR